MSMELDVSTFRSADSEWTADTQVKATSIRAAKELFIMVNIEELVPPTVIFASQPICGATGIDEFGIIDYIDSHD